MGVTISINAISGIAISLYWTAPAAAAVIDWGSFLAVGALGALGLISASGSRNHNDRGNNLSDYVSHNIISNLSNNPQLTQTIFQSTPRRNYNVDESSIRESFHFSSSHRPQPMNKEKEEKKIFDESSTKHEADNFSNYNNDSRFNAFPSSSRSVNKELKSVKKTIEIFGQDHITDLLITKIRNKHYYLNNKNKKIMEPENFKLFREKNLKELNNINKGIKIFKKIVKRYNLIEKQKKIDSIIMKKEKKNSHKVVEVSSEFGKSIIEHYWSKKYFMNTLRKTQEEIKNVLQIYKKSKIVKAGKFIVRTGGTIGTGFVITLIADELIEGTCNLVCFGMKKIIDIFEDEK